MTTRLRKIKVDEVSLVTKPAIAKEFLLYKSEDGTQEEPIMTEEVTKTTEPVVEAPVVREKFPVVEVPPIKHAIDTQKAEEPIVEKEVKCPVCGQTIDEEEAEHGDMCKACAKKEVCPECGMRHDGANGEMCKACAKKEVCPECGKRHDGAKGEMCKACSGKVKKESDVTKQIEDIQKALEQERVEKAALASKIAELEKAANDVKQAEITKAFIEKAATELRSVPGMTAQSFGPVLKAASDKLAPVEFNAIYEALKAASAFIQANSRLTKELGVGGEDVSADPAQQLDAIAKSYVAKDIKMTFAKAYEKACMNNPQLYAEHVRQARNR